MLGRRLVLGVALFGALAGPARPGPAAAHESCTNRVVDESGQVGSLGPGLDQAANALSKTTGAELYVRVMSTVPGGDIDAWQAGAEQRCPNWREAGSETRRLPTLVVLAVSVNDRKTGIYYGERWKPALDPKWRSIQDNAMNPRFRSGDIGGGLLQGLSEVVAAIAPASAAVPTTEAPFRDAERRVVERVPAPDPMPTGGDDGGAGAWPALIVGLGAVSVVFGIAKKLSGGSGGGGMGSTSYPPAYVQDGDNDGAGGLFGALLGGGRADDDDDWPRSGGGSSFGSGGGSSSGGGGSTSWGGGGSSGGSSSGGGGGGGSTSW